MERTSDFEQLLFLYKTDGNSLAPKFNMRWELEAQETTSEPVQEYLSIDKITLVKMLLASKEENKKLHDKLDKLREEAQEREAKAEEREAKAEARNEELMRANRRQMEYQVKLMDQLTEMQRQLNKTNDQYADHLVEPKRQKDLNKQARKDKYDNK